MKTERDRKLAVRWAADERTIRRWKRDGAPLESAAKMRTWLAGRKHLPAGTRTLLEAHRASERATAAKEPHGLQEGASGALRRLESAEARAFSSFRAATEAGDAPEIKATRETWLRISESLRRYDLALEMSRRDSGELMPRVQIERFAKGFVAFFVLGLRGFLRNEAPRNWIELNLQNDVHAVAKGFDQIVGRALIVAFGALRAWPYDGEVVPEWLLAKAEEAAMGHSGWMSLSGDAKAFAEALLNLPNGKENNETPKEESKTNPHPQ